MSNLWNREPTMILATAQAIIALGVGFGLKLTTEQTTLIMAATAAILGLWTRSKVTPA